MKNGVIDMRLIHESRRYLVECLSNIGVPQPPWELHKGLLSIGKALDDLTFSTPCIIKPDDMNKRPIVIWKYKMAKVLMAELREEESCAPGQDYILQEYWHESHIHFLVDCCDGQASFEHMAPYGAGLIGPIMHQCIIPFVGHTGHNGRLEFTLVHSPSADAVMPVNVRDPDYIARSAAARLGVASLA